MTAIKDEESFPRGRSSSTKPALRNVKDKLFKKYKKPKKRTFKNSFFEENQIKGKFKKSATARSSDLEPSHPIRSLTYQSLEEGMVVVGRIREIHPYHVFICLPGKLSAKVPITAISEPYSNSLARLQKLEITHKDCPPLIELFTVGQAVICSIVEVKKDNNLLAVIASLDPTLVNKERSHHVVRAGQTLVAAVRTVEDHGYTLHTGIGGLTTFLKFGNAAKHVELRNQGRPLVVGEVLRCVVTKCTTARSSSRAEVTLDPRVVAETVISEGNMQTLQPGTPVSCVVQQSSKAGLVVNVGRCKAYVEAAQLPNCWSSPKYIQEEDELSATVIYSLPNTDFQITARPTYLTLKNLSQPISPKLEIGKVIEAKVAASGRKGLILCLGDKKDKDLGNKGFVSIRRLGEVIPKENIAKKFPKGTIVTTKILAFDFMEEIYNCTLERAKLEQHYVSISQAKVGDRVTCRIIEVEATGLRLGLGPVRLYAFKEHTADVPYDDLQQHFKAGDIVDARVLRVNPANHQVYVTLKETLIRYPALTSYESANKNESYWGTVRKVNPSNSLYITFYNDVAGILELGDTPSSEFKEGQLVKCYVIKVNPQNRKLTLSLNEPKGGLRMNPLSVGEFYQLVVSSVSDNYLEVSPCDFEGIEGLVPKCHLHDPNQFSEGDFIRAWLYHKKGKTHYFSPNPGIEYFLKNPSNIKVRYRMTCCVNSVQTTKQKKVTVLTSLPELPVVNVSRTEWPLEEQPQLHQLVRLYVKEYDPAKKILTLTSKKPPKQVNDSISQDGQKPTTLENQENCIDINEKSSKAKGNKKETKNDSDTLKQDDKAPSCSKKIDKNPHIKSKEKLETSRDENPSKKNVIRDSKENLKEDDIENTPKVEVNSELHTSNLDSDSSLMRKEAKKRGAKNNFIESVKEISSVGKTKLKKSKVVYEELHRICDESDLNTSDFDSDDSTKEVMQNKKMKNSNYGKDQIGDDKDDKSHKKRKSSESESDLNQGNKSNKKQKIRKSSVSDSDIVEEPKSVMKKATHPKTPKPTLSEAGFLWDIKPEDLSKPPDDAAEDIDEEEEDSNKEKKKKKTSAERRQAAKEEEARLRQVEQTLLDSENNPQSVDQFDRGVLARPDDDELWIKYMSHHLQATEIEKARAVARRALQTINQRFEVERLNIWIALLNLENLFGTQESLKNTLDEALRTNDEFTVYSKMLNIYSQANKAQEAEQLVHVMLRKFRESLECWVVTCSALMSCGLADKARNLLQRAISALPSKQHVNLLCKFALLENQHGNNEQAQTLFEHILTTYPKRTDIWNVYVDMLVKSEKVNVARQVLERATKQKLPPRKMKMLFNKWISFEEKNGTPEKVDYVRKQALAYVNNVTNKLDQ